MLTLSDSVVTTVFVNPAYCVLLLDLLQVSGTVQYNGEDFSQFVVERTAAYVDQVGNPASSCSARHIKQTFAVDPCMCCLECRSTHRESHAACGISKLWAEGDLVAMTLLCLYACSALALTKLPAA
jgi:hypothetical protein